MRDRRGSMFAGLVMVGVGTIFLLVNLGYIPNIGEMWPLFPIIVGLALIIGSMRKKKSAE